MDLCTATNKKYLSSVFNLINSYMINSYNKNIFVYCFDMTPQEVSDLNTTIRRTQYVDVKFLWIPPIIEYCYHPTLFFYKVYALHHCINQSQGFIYSDATNAFNRFVDIKEYMISDSLLLPYNQEIMINKHWTTNRCIEKMQCQKARLMPQYWAGFQVYLSTQQNRLFLQEMYDYMMDPEIAYPDTSIRKPEGDDSECIEHRQDQSVLSLLVDKYDRHQKYDLERQLLFGDWQTFRVFSNDYSHDIERCCLSSRESKFGNYRFL